jgi:sorbitol-specific phosphotransferase system component IIC
MFPLSISLRIFINANRIMAEFVVPRRLDALVTRSRRSAFMRIGIGDVSVFIFLTYTKRYTLGQQNVLLID